MKRIYQWFYRTFPPEMVGYWKTKAAVRAKVTEAADGSFQMWMEGEKYPFPGFPRSHLLFGKLSPLKHEIKTRIFNESWANLEENKPLDIKDALDSIYAIARDCKYDMLPYFRLCPAVKEMYKNLSHEQWRDILAFIMQEDDAYRWRFQWMSQYLTKKDPIGSFDKAMEMLEHAEIVGDMKERVRLIRRVMNELFKDPIIAQYWIDFVRNSDLKKYRLTKADKFYFRAKYFKVDFPKYEY